jgi:hypothetical protein
MAVLFLLTFSVMMQPAIVARFPGGRLFSAGFGRSVQASSPRCLGAKFVVVRNATFSDSPIQTRAALLAIIVVR